MGGMKERKNSTLNKISTWSCDLLRVGLNDLKRIFFKSFEPTLNRSHDHVDIYSTRRCSFFPSFLPLQLPTPHQIATSPPPTCWGAAGWQGIVWISSREQGMGDSRRMCVSSPLVCFFSFFFLSFFLLLINITLAQELWLLRYHYRHAGGAAATVQNGCQDWVQGRTRDADASRVLGTFIFSYFFFFY